MQTKIKVGGAIVSAAIAALSFSFNAFNVKPNISWSWIALISFLVFVGFVAYGWIGAENRARRLEFARPSVVFSNLSPATSILSPTMKRAFFTRVEFINNTAHPTGDNSTAQKLAASLRVFDKNNREIDNWDGRWANVNEPTTPSEIWSANRIDLPANNQRAILDIGYRVEGEKVFNGWDNLHYLNASQRVPIKPGVYELQIELAASNMEYSKFGFSLTIPDESQTDVNNVTVELLPLRYY